MARATVEQQEVVPPPKTIVLELTEHEASLLKVLTGQLSKDEWEARSREFTADSQKFVSATTRTEIYHIYNVLHSVVKDPKY